MKQIELFKSMLEKAGPDARQDADSSFSLPLGEMFSVLVYGQLILEQCELSGIEADIISQLFEFMVRDFARFALQIYGMENTKEEQQAYCKQIMEIRAQGDAAQYDRVWTRYVAPLNGEYELNP